MNGIYSGKDEGLTVAGNGAPGAAVVGSSIVSFDEGMSAQDREDVYLSNLYAQLATRSAYKDGLVGNWFDYYTNKLRYLGWDSARPVRPERAVDGSMADSVSQQISQSLGGQFSLQTNKALAALKNNHDALETFEGASLQSDVGFFQVVPCALKSRTRIEIALYHRQFSTRRTVSRFLFWPMDNIVKTSREEIAVVTFNTLHYATFRKKVAAAVVREVTRHLHALDV